MWTEDGGEREQRRENKQRNKRKRKKKPDRCSINLNKHERSLDCLCMWKKKHEKRNNSQRTPDAQVLFSPCRHSVNFTHENGSERSLPLRRSAVFCLLQLFDNVIFGSFNTLPAAADSPRRPIASLFVWSAASTGTRQRCKCEIKQFTSAKLLKCFREKRAAASPNEWSVLRGSQESPNQIESDRTRKCKWAAS